MKIVILALPALALAAPLIANHEAISDIQAHALESYRQIKFIPVRDEQELPQTVTSTPSNETRVYDPHTTEPHRPVQVPNNQAESSKLSSPALGGGCYKPKPIAKRGGDNDSQDKEQEQGDELLERRTELSMRRVGTPNPAVERPVCRPVQGSDWRKRAESKDMTEQEEVHQDPDRNDIKTLSDEELWAVLFGNLPALPSLPGMLRRDESGLTEEEESRYNRDAEWSTISSDRILRNLILKDGPPRWLKRDESEVGEESSDQDQDDD